MVDYSPSLAWPRRYFATTGYFYWATCGSPDGLPIVAHLIKFDLRMPLVECNLECPEISYDLRQPSIEFDLRIR